MAEPVAPQPAPSIPQRELRDPRVLRALAHPVRLRILDELATLGQATATELADRLGESPANCSWHLRQLAQHGFIEEAEGGTGRQRPWKPVIQSTRLARPDPAHEEPELATAREALMEVLIRREVDAWLAWATSRTQEPAPWQEASFATQSTPVWLTAEELAALKRDLFQVVERHILGQMDRVDPARRPEGSRPTRFVAWGIPSGPPHRTE